MDLNVIGKAGKTEKLIAPSVEKEALVIGSDKIDLAAVQKAMVAGMTKEGRTARKSSKARITMDRDGNISVNTEKDYWLVAEVDVPDVEYVEQPTGEKSDDGTDVVSRVRAQIKDVNVKLWPLP